LVPIESAYVTSY